MHQFYATLANKIMKIKDYTQLLFLLALLLLVSCSSVEESIYEEDVSTICPDVNQLLFEASALSTFDLKVANNAKVWDAIVDKDWCIIEKGDKNIIVKSKPNIGIETRTASISLLHNNVVKQTIYVEQKAAAEGVITPSKVIWDDTHWRLYGLKGRVKSIEQGNMPTRIEFNLDGKQVLWGDKNREQVYIMSEYNSNGKITKQTFYNSNGTVRSTKVFTYGSHTKYVPSFADYFGSSNEILYLVQGLEKVEITNSEGTTVYDLKVSGNTITINNPSTEYTINSPQDLPSSIELKAKNDNVSLTYKYANNGMPIEYLYSDLDEESEIRSYISHLYFDTTSPFILQSKYERLQPLPYTKTLEYDANGNIVLETTKYSYEFPSEGKKVYSQYQLDAQGNWIQRINEFDAVEKRTIVYFE